MSSLIRDLRTGVPRQFHIITSLAHREFRMRNKKFAFALLFDLVEMLLTIVVMAAIAHFLMRRPPIGDSEVLFIASGLLPITYFRATSTRTAGGVQLRTAARPFPHVTVLDSALAKALVETIMFSIATVIVIFVCATFAGSKFAIPYNPMALLQALAAMFVFGFGIGLVNAAIKAYFPLWKTIWMVFTRLQIFTSGVHALPDTMPPQVRELIYWNPLAHMVALARTAFYPMYPGSFIDMGYATLWAFAALVIGLMTQQVMRSRLSAS